MEEPPKQTVARYALRVAEVVLDDAGRVSQEDRQDAAGERVERPAVTDALGRRQPADECDDVVRCRPGRLVDDEDPVQSGTER